MKRIPRRVKAVKIERVEDFRTVDWFGIKPNRQKQEGRIKSGKGSLFINSFLPLSADYFNPLHPAFISQIGNLSDLNQEKTWFFRDGLLPLIFFFEKFKNPQVLKTRIYLTHLAAPFVPESWKKHVRYYEIVSIMEPPAQQPVIIGLQTTGMLKDKKLVLEKIKFLAANRKSVNICFWQRWGNSANHSEDLIPISSLRRLGKAKLVFDDPVQFFLMKDLTGQLFIDLSFDFYIADRTITHYALARHGQCFGVRQVDRDQIDLLLSPYHGFQFSMTGKSWTSADVRETLKIHQKEKKYLSSLFNEAKARL